MLRILGQNVAKSVFQHQKMQPFQLCQSRSFALKSEKIKIIPRAQRQQLSTKKGKKKTGWGKIGAFGTIAGAGICWKFLLEDEDKKKINKLVSDSILGSLYKYCALQISTVAKPFTDPSHEKILPDWPMPSLNLPPNFPALPTLVIDLENTLLHSEWDRRHGWRHAKRPDVTKFLDIVSRHYEVVLFSNQTSGFTEELMHQLDKNNRCLHFLYRDSTRFMNGTHVKDISHMNRNQKRIVIIDDDPAAYQLQPENAIPIAPYLNGEDRDDHALMDLIPFLTALAVEHVQDVPATLNQFRDDDGIIRDLPDKYAARVHAKEIEKSKKQRKGLGGLMRGRMSQSKNL